MFTPMTAKAYRKGYATGRTSRTQREKNGVPCNLVNPYHRNDYRKVWDKGFKDGESQA